MKVGGRVAWLVVLLAGLLAPSCTSSPRQAVPPASLTKPPNTTQATGALQAAGTAEQVPAVIQPDEQWIEVSLGAQQVLLHDGHTIVGTLPAATGMAVDAATTTEPGLYRVQSMTKGPMENVPGVFVSDILIFDLRNGAGIHSLPRDRDGKVLDERLSQAITAGCVRVRESARVFDFALLGMRVWIH